jgi:multiple sugar transport system permease protein
MVPFLWMISTSLKEYADIYSIPVTLIPRKFIFSNYAEVFAVSEYVNIMRGFLNTMAIVIPTVTIGCLTSALAAFAFAKITFPGRDIIFFGFIITMAIPGIITLIPSYMIFVELKWVNTWLPLMIPGMFGGASTVFFTRQFMKGIPVSLEEAAKMDGMSWLGIFLRIELPLSKAVLMTNLIFGFIGGYNDYLGPVLYLNSANHLRTLQQMLVMLNNTAGTRLGAQMAGACIAILPIIALFILAQRYFVEGITLSGIKG